MRPFLTEKIRNRLQFHGSCRQNLHRSLGKTILPSDYGGDQVGLEQHRWQLHHWVSAAGGGWRWPGGVDRSSYQTLRLLFTFATTICLSFCQILIFDATSVRKLNFIGGMLYYKPGYNQISRNKLSIAKPTTKENNYENQVHYQLYKFLPWTRVDAANMMSCQSARPMATQRTTCRPVSPSSTAWGSIMVVVLQLS